MFMASLIVVRKSDKKLTFHNTNLLPSQSLSVSLQRIFNLKVTYAQIYSYDIHAMFS